MTKYNRWGERVREQERKPPTDPFSFREKRLRQVQGQNDPRQTYMTWQVYDRKSGQHLGQVHETYVGGNKKEWNALDESGTWLGRFPDRRTAGRMVFQTWMPGSKTLSWVAWDLRDLKPPGFRDVDPTEEIGDDNQSYKIEWVSNGLTLTITAEVHRA